MKASKKIVALSVFCLMIFNTVSVFAADRDVWEKATDTKFATRMEMRQDKAKILKVRQRPVDYYFEANGHLFEMKTMYQEFAKDKLNFVTKLVKGNSDVKPVPADELKVVSVSAIDATKDNKLTVGSATDSTLALQATVVDNNGNPAVASVTWSSSDNTIATVDGNGVVSAVKEGSATISATVGTSVKTYIVQVLPQDKPDLESVEVINRNQILLTFNRELDQTTAETVTNYFINNMELLNAKDEAELDPTDATKVTLTFKKAAPGDGVLAAAGSATQIKVKDAGYLDNDATYSIKVKNNALKTSDGEKLFVNPSDVPVKSVTFSDHKKPQVKKASFSESGDLVVVFDEEVFVETALNNKITYNNKIVAITKPAAAETLATQKNSAAIVVNKANLTALTPALESGKTYPLVVQGIKDLSGNIMDIYQANLPYVSTVTVPTVKEVVAEDEKTLSIEISKPLGGLLIDGTTVFVYKGMNKLALAGVNDVSAKYGLAPNTKFELELPTVADVLYNSALNETSAVLKVQVKDAKDASNNPITPYEGTVTVTKDTTKPAFITAEYPAVNKIKVRVNKALAAVAANSLKFEKIVVTDKDDVVHAIDKNAQINIGDKEFIIESAAALPVNQTLHVKLLPGLFADDTLNGGNKNDLIEFDIVTGTPDATLPTATIVSSDTNENKITITYDEAMKTGVGAHSVTNLANYSYGDGKAIPADSITVNPAKTIVTIVFKKETIKDTESLLFKISNVQDLAGNPLDPATASVFLQITDNIAPTLDAAVVQTVQGRLELTFSEKVDGTGAGTYGTLPVAGDFEIFRDGIKLGVPTVANHATDDTKIYLTPGGGDSFLTGTITVKVKDGATGADEAGNKIKGHIPSATKN